MPSSARASGETLGVAEIVADAEQLERIQDGKSIVLGLPDVESYQRTTKSHLLFGEVVLGMIGTPRIMDLCDCSIIRQKVGDFRGGLAVAGYAQGQRFQPFERIPK